MTPSSYPSSENIKIYEYNEKNRMYTYKVTKFRSFIDCHMKDFLPFQCGKCHKIFCLNHRSCSSHNCPKADIDNVILIICPACSAKIKITGADNPNDVFDKHRATECRPDLAERDTKERCDAEGCHVVLTPINTYTCVKCGGLKYCMKHR